MAEEKIYTFEEVSKHNTAQDLWIVYNGYVYDVGSYIDEHPGGEEVIVDCAGTDATEAFDDIGHSDDAHDILVGLKIGKLEGAVPKNVSKSNVDSQTSAGIPTPLIAVAVIALAAGAYFYLN